jgi:hypothetical protein
MDSVTSLLMYDSPKRSVIVFSLSIYLFIYFRSHLMDSVCNLLVLCFMSAFCIHSDSVTFSDSADGLCNSLSFVVHLIHGFQKVPC